MALKRVTMQDIADACGLSRNTVSKIFNNRGSIPDATQKMVLKKAQELGYSQIPSLLAESESVPPKKISSPIPQSITILAHSNPLNHNFGSLFIKAFTDQVCRSGYTVQLYEISSDELKQMKLPPHISLKNTAGILCIELFDKEFLQIVCDLGLPSIIVDGFCNTKHTLIGCDYILMENTAASAYLTEHLLSQGAKTIGFVGDIFHCNSFFERWNGFSYVLGQNNIEIDKRICIIENNDSPYGDHEWLCDKIKRMPFLPDAFFCVNDFHAIHIINALKACNVAIPSDVMVTGFDNSPESMVIEPSLTTVNIPSTDIGIKAADILLTRISNPVQPYSMTYVQTTPIIRESSTGQR